MKRLVLVTLVILATTGLVTTSALAARDTGEDWRLTRINLVSQTGTIYWGSWYSGGVLAGAIYMKVEDFVGKPGDPPNQPPNSVYYAWVYCIEAEAMVVPDWYKQLVGQKPTQPDQSKPLIEDDNWARKVWLIQHYGWNSWLSAPKSAGLQLAIWEVISDDDFNLDTGTFKIGSDFGTSTDQTKARYWAEQYLTAVSSINWQMVDISKDICYIGGQNMNEVTVIPEATTLILSLTGLGAVAGFRRFRLG
ncbi:MAG: thioester domain-containing protein [Armatimonadota bacterium]